MSLSSNNCNAVPLSTVGIIQDWSVLSSLMAFASWMVMLGPVMCPIKKFAGICSQLSCHIGWRWRLISSTAVT